MAEKVLQGHPDAYSKVVEDITAFDDIQEQALKFTVNYSNIVEIEFQVKTEEIVPNETLTLTKTGKISRRAMGKTKYYSLIKDHVCSSAIWAAQHIFAYLPVDQAIVHVTDHLLNTATGHHEDMVLLSVYFEKNTMIRLNFSK